MPLATALVATLVLFTYGVVHLRDDMKERRVG